MFRIVVLVLCVALSHGFALEPTISSRIVGGDDAEIEDVPYQASLRGPQNRHICGAVVIGRSCLVTAAHCIDPSFNAYQVRVGSAHLSSGTVYHVKEVIVNENYTSFDYDVAVLKLNKTMVFNRRVQPLKLATAEPKVKTWLTLSGWGRIENANGPTPTDLQILSVPVVNKQLCARLYETIRPLTDRMFCAGFLDEAGRGVCFGDSGGPLAANGILYGIVSWGRNCAQPDSPGIYANVAKLRPFIRKHCKV